jgi:hypothetical protein
MIGGCGLDLAQDRDERWAVLNTEMNIWFSFSRKTILDGVAVCV